MIRCFFALPLEERALHCAQELLDELRGRVEHVRWVPKNSMHVTVHFFGMIDEQESRRASSAVAPVCAATPPMAMRFDSLGSFPDRGTPRVLWLGAAATHPAVDAFVARVHQALNDSGFAMEKRSFRLHCTLGRVRDTWSAAQQRQWDVARSDLTYDHAQTSTRLVLYESKVSASGSIYSERAVLPLAG